MLSETAYKTQKLLLLCGQAYKRVSMWVMHAYNPHKLFKLFMDFRVSNYKKPIPNSHYRFSVTGDVIFPNSLYHTCVLNSSLTLLFFFLLVLLNLSIRLVSRCSVHFSLSLRLALVITDILSLSHLS